MKKLLLLALATLALSCSEKEATCMYSKMTFESLNYNKMPVISMEKETTEGCYSITKTETSAELTDAKGKFKINFSTNPNAITITDKDGTEKTLKESDDFKIGNEMVGDTLVIKYIPIPSSNNSLKFGLIYKFY